MRTNRRQAYPASPPESRLCVISQPEMAKKPATATSPRVKAPSLGSLPNRPSGQACETITRTASARRRAFRLLRRSGKSARRRAAGRPVLVSGAKGPAVIARSLPYPGAQPKAGWGHDREPLGARSATTIATASAQIASSAQTAGERLAEAAQLAATARTVARLHQLTVDGRLSPDQRARIAAEDGAASLARVLRRARAGRPRPPANAAGTPSPS